MTFFFMRNNNPFNRNDTREYDGRKEGEVSVQSDHSNKKKIDKDLGEYVNYEEIDN